MPPNTLGKVGFSALYMPMSMISSLLRSILLSGILVTLAVFPADSQQATDAPAAKAPLDHVIGTITAVDQSAQTVTVKEDKTGTSHTIQLANTKTLLKVEPTAKDLKSAVRITAGDLEVGDRVDIRGTKTDDSSTTLNARSVILMSGRALEATHEQQAAAWAHSTMGVVTAVDPASGKITADVKAAGATTSVTLQTSSGTEFTRYAPDSGKAVPSQIAQIQPGDQVRVIGEKSDDGASITAQRVYSGAFRTIPATIVAVGADGKSMTIKNLANKKDVTVALSADAAIHRLPPMMAGFLARRLNPAAAGAAGSGGANGTGPGAPAGGNGAPTHGGGAPNDGTTPTGPGAGPGGGPAGTPGGGPGGAGGSGGRGDISQMIARLPTIPVTDLKPGDAVVVSGVADSSDNSHLIANTVVAGVEPIFQAAPQQRGGSRGGSAAGGGDWGLGEMSIPQ